MALNDKEANGLQALIGVKVAPNPPKPDPSKKSRERILATTTSFADYYKAVSNHPNDNKAFPYAIEAAAVTGHRKYKNWKTKGKEALDAAAKKSNQDKPLYNRVTKDLSVAPRSMTDDYFKDGANDFRWAETAYGEDSPTGEPIILINRAKYEAADAEPGYEEVVVATEAIHNLKFADHYEDSAGLQALFYQEMVKQNILFSNVLYIQFSHTEEDILRTIEASDRAFKFVKENMVSVDAALEGRRSVEVFRKNT